MEKKVIRTHNNPKVPLKYLPIFLLTVIFISVSFSGYNGERINYILLALFAMWIIVAALTDFKSFLRIFKRKTVIAFILYMIFYLITALFSPDMFQTVKLIGFTFVLFSPLLVFTYFSVLGQERLFKRLLIVSLIILFCFCILALNFYANNENAARILASDSQAFDSLAIGGGYGLAYGAAIFAVYLFDLWLSRIIKTKKLQVLTFLAVIILSLVVLETKSTITILALFVGLILCVTLKKEHRQTENITNKQIIPRRAKLKISLRKMFIFAMAIILLISFAFFYQDIGFWIIDKTSQSNDIVSNRVSEIGVKLAYGEAGEAGDLDSRIYILKTALGSFTYSPVIGHGYKYGYIFQYGTLYGVGNHCEWLDAFATMGFLGGIPFLLIYVFAIYEERKYNGMRVSSAYIIVVFLLGLLNPFRTYQSNFVVFYLLISISYLFHINDLKQKEILPVDRK